MTDISPEEPKSLSYQRYLKAKKTVDDRALNHQVWKTFLKRFPASADLEDRTARVLEIGGGVGSTVRRILDNIDQLAVHEIDYTLVDISQESLNVAHEQLQVWGRDLGYDVWSSGDRVVLTGSTMAMSIRLVHGDAFDVMDAHAGPPFNVVIAQAVLDILDVSEALASIRDVSAEGAVWYFPIHFDGGTVFVPEVESVIDNKIERLFHASMDEREGGETGGSKTGRRLFRHLRDAGADVLAAGSSDWVVHAGPDGNYVRDEAYFLHHILHFVESELIEHPGLNSESLEAWLETRRMQIEFGELVYIAHQLDFVAQVSVKD